MGRGSEEPVEFENAECVAETASAILVKLADHDEPVWFPQSQVHEDSEVYEKGGSGRLVVTHWIAKEKGLL